MRVIILHQFFYPDHSAVSQLMTDLAEDLVTSGIEVMAVAGRGRYNGGERLQPRENYRGVRIERAWTTSFGKTSNWGRLADYLTFYCGAVWKLLFIPRHDIMMTLTTPPLIGLLGLLVARLRGMRVVALVQDIYPDVAVVVGAISAKSLSTRLLAWLNTRALANSDRIIVLGECMKQRIAGKVGSKRYDRIDVIPNWADGGMIGPLKRGEPNPFAEKHGLTGKFVVLFSGNFGLVNDFATVLEAACLLRERTDIAFIFIGDGAKAAEINAYVAKHHLRNIRQFPYQSRADLRYTLAAGDALLVTLAPGLAGISVPSKTYPILAAARPVLFVGDTASDIARLVVDQGCGAIIEAGDSGKLAEVIMQWAAAPQIVTELGAQARRVFEAGYDRPHAVAAYRQSFERVYARP